MNAIFEDNAKSDIKEILINNSPSVLDILSYRAKEVQVKNCSFIYSDNEHLSSAIHSSTSNILFFGNVFSKCNANTL